MKIEPKQLTEKGYIQLDQLEHKELLPFIRTYMKKRTKYSLIYYVSNMILFGLVGYFFVLGFNMPNYSFGDRLIHFSYGLPITFALIPLHEYLHVLAYKSQGAKNTSYDANLKKFYFMALADKFVANKKEFAVVALTPFIVISTTLTLILFFVNSEWVLTVISVLLVHTSMCAGDFGLLSYFECNKEKQVVTYDDIENKISYFYGRIDDKKTTA
jgi:Putative zincin peptidase